MPSTESLLFADVRLPLPTGPRRGWLATAGDRIAALGIGDAPAEQADGRRPVDGAGRTLMPGFVDVHLHGAVGREAMDADPDGLAEIAAFLVRHGVTSFLATTWTAPADATLAALEAIRTAVGRPRPAGTARLLGAHMEGPFLNPERAGAQDVRHIRAPAPGELERHLDVGVTRLMTLAPELPHNAAVLRALRERGITASAGHTDATYDDMVEALGRGLRHVTHTFNAMRGFAHREPGCAGAALTLDLLRCELIADGFHVGAPAMDLLFRAKGAGGVVLVSDSVRPTGLPDGEHPLDHRTVRLSEGSVRFADGSLAGSALTLDLALRNVAAATGIEPAALWPATSGNAARSAGVADRKGRLEAGLDADLVLLDEATEVALTVVEGEIAYDRDGMTG